jgi:geranylgeranyl pyrophosphate synthase
VTRSPSTIALLEPVRAELEQVRSLLRRAALAVDEPLRSVLLRSLGGGKLLRPALVVLIGRLFEAPPEPFRRLAAAVDMLHTATLIHDDLIDGASVRRGQATLHAVWSAQATVLAGDYLLAEAMVLVVELGDSRVARTFVEILRTMCASEIARILAVRCDGDPTSRRHLEQWRTTYYQCIEAKTASLFAAPAQMAAMLAGAEETQIAAVGRYAQALGLAFQIVDDVLDVTGDQSQLGKPVGSDLRQGAVTLPLLCHLELGNGNGPVHTVLRGQRDEEHVHAALKTIRGSGAIDAALREAEHHVGRSQEALASLPDNPARAVLHDMAHYVIRRRQ